ncbi:MAG: DUF3786 domain-containing protein [Deltaproteobacteria bacterium]|nr:DUF3786 domain-containing protein [Deltaproteobacteria bacterium]
MNPLEVLQRTPKSNCGACGYPACLAFAAHVARSGEDPRKCPYINLDGLACDTPGKTPLEQIAAKHDFDLVHHLQSKIKDLDFHKIAGPLGLSFSAGQDDLLAFSYLGQHVLLSKKQILMDGKEPEDPRDQILLYNYIHSRGGNPPSGTWTGLESLPNSISKSKTLATYCEERLSLLFTGLDSEAIYAFCGKIGGRAVAGSSATAAAIIPVLPRLPQQLLFWDAEPADGFAARTKILFDQNVLTYLDLESLVFSAERLADRLVFLFSQSKQQ